MRLGQSHHGICGKVYEERTNGETGATAWRGRTTRGAMTTSWCERPRVCTRAGIARPPGLHPLPYMRAGADTPTSESVSASTRRTASHTARRAWDTAASTVRPSLGSTWHTV